MTATETPRATFDELQARRRALKAEIALLEVTSVPSPADLPKIRRREAEARRELEATLAEIRSRFGSDADRPLPAGAEIRTPSDVNRRLIAIAGERERLGAARRAATGTAEIKTIDAGLRTLEDEELTLGNRRRELARAAEAAQSARERARVAAEEDRRYRAYLLADALFDEILERLDQLDAVRQTSGLEDLSPVDFDTGTLRRRIQPFELLDRWRHEIKTRWLPYTMPAVREWAAAKPPAEPVKTRRGGIFGRAVR